MSPSYIDYRQLSHLGDKVRAGAATKQEKDEFMRILHQNGSITNEQYEAYKKDQNTEDIVKAGLAVGAVILIGYLLKEMFSSK